MRNLAEEVASRPDEERKPNGPTVSEERPGLMQRYGRTAQWLFPVLQIYGGGTAAVNFGRLLPANGHDRPSIALLIVAIGLGLFSVLAAVRVFQGKPNGATLCFWAWAPQIPDFVTNHLSYFLCLPFRTTLLVGWDAPRIAFEGQFALAFVARLDQEAASPYLGVNVLALLAAIYFWNARRASS